MNIDTHHHLYHNVGDGKPQQQLNQQQHTSSTTEDDRIHHVIPITSNDPVMSTPTQPQQSQRRSSRKKTQYEEHLKQLQQQQQSSQVYSPRKVLPVNSLSVSSSSDTNNTISIHEPSHQPPIVVRDAAVTIPSATTTTTSQRRRRRHVGPQHKSMNDATSLQQQLPPIDEVFVQTTGIPCTDPELLKRPSTTRWQKMTSTTEVDYYLNPTMLSQLILHQMYKSAIQRILNHPDEVSIWLCSFADKPNTTTTNTATNALSPTNVSSSPPLPPSSPSSSSPSSILHQQPQAQAQYTIRQLPIHIACMNLCRTSDVTKHTLLNELISLLVYTYPIGAHQVDHRGIYPIQQVIFYGNATPETIAIFLMAKPESLLMVDQYGRTLRDLHQYRVNRYTKKHAASTTTRTTTTFATTQQQQMAIQRLLDRTVQFWKVARSEAAVRLQHNKSLLYPSDLQSINSQSVLASSNVDEDTIYTINELSEKSSKYKDDSSVTCTGTKQSINTNQPHVEKTSWEQLEERTRMMEHLLHTVNEENYHLKQQLENSMDHHDKKNNSFTATTTSSKYKDVLNEMQQLQDDNLLLQEKIYKMELILKQYCVTEDEEMNEQFRLAFAEISSLIDISNPSSSSTVSFITSGFHDADSKASSTTPSNDKLLFQQIKQIKQHLSKKHNLQREKIRKLRHMISYSTLMLHSSMINDPSDEKNEEIEKDSSSSYAEVSTISALTLETAKSDISYIIHKQRFHYNEGVVDQIPQLLVNSDLPARPPPKKDNKNAALDDLSYVLRYAAKQQQHNTMGTREVQKQHRQKRKKNILMKEDDLSVIFHWAAKTDRRDVIFYNDDDEDELTIDIDDDQWSPIHPMDIWFHPSLSSKYELYHHHHQQQQHQQQQLLLQQQQSLDDNRVVVQQSTTSHLQPQGQAPLSRNNTPSNNNNNNNHEKKNRNSNRQSGKKIHKMKSQPSNPTRGNAATNTSSRQQIQQQHKNISGSNSEVTC
jgi:hypothetical protein